MAVTVYSKSELDAGLNLEAAKLDTYTQAEVIVALSTLQAGIDRRFSSIAVNIDGKFFFKMLHQMIVCKLQELTKVYYMMLQTYHLI